MFRKLLKNGLCFRGVSSNVATKYTGQVTPQISQSEEGYRLVTLPDPYLSNKLSRIVLVYKVGSRNESIDNCGISHLIRRAFGVSSLDLTIINQTRHFQQMGAQVNCTSTREHLIYTVDVAPNLVKRASYLLFNMATSPLYQEWELKTVYQYMRKDVDILNRRNLNALSMELLHEAAFGQSPSGNGLGFSLYSPADRIGSHSFDQITEFHQSFFTPQNCCVVLMGSDAYVDSMDALKETKGAIKTFPNSTKAPTAACSFVGGQIRRDLIAAPAAHAYLAIATNTTMDNSSAFDVAVSYLNGASNRIHYGGDASNCFIAQTQTPELDTFATTFHKAYTDQGLFGIGLAGASTKAMNRRLKNIIQQLRGVNVTDVENAKKMCKANILMSSESSYDQAVQIGVHMTNGNTKLPVSAHEQCAKIDAVTAEQVNEVIKAFATAKETAFSVVGPNVHELDVGQCRL